MVILVLVNEALQTSGLFSFSKIFRWPSCGLWIYLWSLERAGLWKCLLSNGCCDSIVVQCFFVVAVMTIVLQDVLGIAGGNIMSIGEKIMSVGVISISVVVMFTCLVLCQIFIVSFLLVEISSVWPNLVENKTILMK